MPLKRPPGLIEAGGVLDRIVDAKLGRLRRLAAPVVAERSERRSFIQALARDDRINVIAEIKHRSPSRGMIRESFDPVAIARSYEKAGAAALSVLTEEDFFGGSPDHLRAVRQAVSLPLLRKDFIVDASQIDESIGAGADAILLIAAILDDNLLADLLTAGREAGLDVLVEAHTEEEMRRAVAAGSELIGVNNRDLRSFGVDLATSIRLSKLAPDSAVLVSESGISTGEDIRRLRSSGFDAFLIGERLMSAADPGAALATLLAECQASGG